MKVGGVDYCSVGRMGVLGGAGDGMYIIEDLSIGTEWRMKI